MAYSIYSQGGEVTLVKKNGRSSKLVALLLVFTLVFVAGCQAISNVDLNKVLKNALKVTSSESNQSVELKLLVDEAAYDELPEEDLALIKLISSLKIELNNVKAQDSSHVSFDGSLILGDASSIGFSLKMSDTLAVLELEGAKQPYVLDLTGTSLNALTGVAAITGGVETTLDEAALTELSHQLVDLVGNYAINNLPNPERIEVKSANELINGVSTPLMHVHAELDGTEVWTWVNKYVDALVADRAGLDKMVTDVITLLASNPEVWAALGTINPLEQEGLDAPTPEETVKEASDAIAAMLVQLQAELKLVETEDKETFDGLFNKDLNVKADIYVDSKLDIRKEVLEFSYLPSGETDLGLYPLTGLSVKLERDSWNVNGMVKAEEPVASETAMPVEELFSLQGYQILKQFDESSTVYDLLKNQFHIGKQSITWFSDDYNNPPIVTAGGVTLIPLRDTAEQLGAVLTYDKSTKALKVIDEATNTTIIVKVGSDTAVINGKNVKWPFPVTSIDGTAYVPARSFADAIGAKISWSTYPYYDDVKVFELEREV